MKIVKPMKGRFPSLKRWFFEDLEAGEKTDFTWGTAIDKEVYSKKNKYQDILVFDTKDFGRILALDGLVQFSTKYEFIYHEMLVHPAFLCHKNPKKILIIGGGDGGILREVVRYKTEEIYLVEIDRDIIEVSKKYFPSVSDGAFGDKRVRIFIEDGLNFVKKFKNYFDIIIIDSTDPTRFSLPLFSAGFYQNVFKALKKDGILSVQTAYFREEFAKKLRKMVRKIFPYFKIHRAYVGCFPFDEHTFSLGSRVVDFNKIKPVVIQERYKKLNIKTKYYSPEIHFSSGVIPNNLKK